MLAERIPENAMEQLDTEQVQIEELKESWTDTLSQLGKRKLNQVWKLCGGDTEIIGNETEIAKITNKICRPGKSAARLRYDILKVCS